MQKRAKLCKKRCFMRLKLSEQKSIKDTFLKVFQQGDIYLFGSRVDDNQKGGDIDLYIDTKYSDDFFEKKIEFLCTLKSLIGEQKIDLILSKDKNRAIEQEALKTGIKL